MLIYLDNCCYNRPYDEQSSITVSIETQAKLFIQEQIIFGKLRLVSSYVLNAENSMNRFLSRRFAIQQFIEQYSEIYVSAQNKETIEREAGQMMEYSNIKFMDACHLACAIFAKSDYFLSTDYRLLKFRTDEIRLMNPVDFLRELEGFS